MAIRKIYLGLMKIFLFMNGQNWDMEFSKSMDILEINNIRYFIMKNDLSMEELNMSWCQIFALIYPSKVGESKFTALFKKITSSLYVLCSPDIPKFLTKISHISQRTKRTHLRFLNSSGFYFFGKFKLRKLLFII